MGYDIPDEIKYHEKILANFDMKQLVYLIGFLILAALAYGLPLPHDAKLVSAFLTFITGLGFVFFDLEKKILARWKYLTNVRSGGALDRKVRAFVGVKKIERDVVYLNNGEMRAVILVKPINLQLLDEGRQKSTILNYRDFLNQLSHPIQIVVRTVNVSLADYFSSHEAKILKTKNENLISLYNDFRSYEEKFLKEQFVKERLYYVVVPLDPKSSHLSGFFKKRAGLTEKQTDAILRELDERVKIVQSKLGNCSLTSYRLNTNQLISLIMSYFEGYVEVNEDYLWRISVAESFFKERDKHG